MRSLPRQSMSQLPTVTVVVADDHAIWRGGVRSLLEETEFQIVGEAGSGREAVELALAKRPDIVLLDIRMAGGDGLDALAKIKSELPRTAVVMLTTYDNPTYLARAVAGGAAGYLLKGVQLDEFLSALRAVADGEMLLSREELGRSLHSLDERTLHSSQLISPLSQRETQVLQLLATGLPNREIAAILFVAESTIKTHVEHIIGKLGVSDRVQAAVWAARQGLVETTAQ